MEYAAPLATLLLGAYLGYLFRLQEFRRDRRLQIYGEFAGAFLTVASAGTSLSSAAWQLGDKLHDPEHRSKVGPIMDRWATAARAFDEAASRLRLVGSVEALTACQELETFLDDNIHALPPITPGDDQSAWGAFASVGPRAVADEASRLARDFADRVRPEVITLRERLNKSRLRFRKTAE